MIAAGTAAFMANYFSFTQEVSPRHTGLVVGFLGALGNLFAAGFQPFAGRDEGPDRQLRAGLRDHRPGPAPRAGGPVPGLGRATVDRPPRRNESMRAERLARSGWTSRGLSGRISARTSFRRRVDVRRPDPPRIVPLARAAVDKARLIWQGGGT